MTNYRVTWDGKRMVPTRYYVSLGVRAKDHRGTKVRERYLLGPVNIRVPKRVFDWLA